MFPGNNPINNLANNGNINNNLCNNFNNMNCFNNQMQFNNNNFAPNNNIISPLNLGNVPNFFQPQFINQFNNNQMNFINNNNDQNFLNNPMNNIMNFNNFQNNMKLNNNLNNNIQNFFINNMQSNINEDGHAMNYLIREEDLQCEEKLSENIVSTMEGTYNIYKQIKNNCICAIQGIQGSFYTYTGFFCYLPYRKKKITVLMTCSSAINRHYNSDKLIIFFDNYKTQKTIKMNKDRILYSSFDLTIIEIKPEDNLNIINFLELDENLFINNSEIIYEKKSLYIPYYQRQKGALVSYGTLNKKVSYYLLHLCKVEESSKGAPIVNLENNKVIGLHVKSNENPYYNQGTFLKYAINDLNNIKNQIQIIVEVNENNINKEVYFLNKDNNKELNENNTKLFIGNKEYKFQKYFQSRKVGKYSIVLKLNTKIKDCSFIFYNCSDIIAIDLSSFSSDMVVNMDSMFSKCLLLKYVDFYSFNSSKVISMKNLFSGCCNLNMIDLLNFHTQNVKDMSGMFHDCTAFKNINISAFSENVTNMSNMFSGCENLTNIDLSNFYTNNVIDMSSMFSGCGLATISLSNFDTKNVKNMSNIFSGCKKLTNIDLSFLNVKNVTNMSQMFSGCEALTKVNFSSFETQKVIDMSNMFSHCSRITSLDLSSFNTINVTNMSHMFSHCENLTNINLSSFNTRNVLDMSNMFFVCHKLKEINLSNFESNKVQNMKWMFYWCGELLYVDFSNFDLNKVENKFQIFGLSSFDINNEGFLPNKNEVKTIKVNKNSYEEFKKQVTAKNANIIIV